MPYTVRKRDDKYCVVLRDTGETVNCSHDTYDSALAQIQAIEINENKAAYAIRADTELHDYQYNGVRVRASRRRPSTRDDAKYMRDVSYDGSERVVHYGQPGVDMQRDEPDRRESFLARHNCDDKRDPFAPGFWACYDWKNTSEKAMNAKSASSLFAYIDLSNNSEIERIQSALRETITDKRIEWESPENFHITLGYSEGVPDADVVNGLSSGFDHFTVGTFPYLGAFNNPGTIPLLLFVNHNDDLDALQKRVFNSLSGDVSPYSEPSRWQPHITLAYMPDDVQVPAIELDQLTLSVDTVYYARDDYDNIIEINSTSGKRMKTDYAVKYIGNPEAGRVGGYLVVWGDEDTRDLQDEYFTPDTEFELDYYPSRPALYHHGLDPAVKSAKIGTIDTLKPDDIGLWAEAQLDMRNEYVRMLREMVEKGAIGWSSGALPQAVEIDNGRIKTWPILEGSLTPAPAEPRQTNVGLLPGKYYKPALQTPSPTHEDGQTVIDADTGDNGEIVNAKSNAEGMKMDMSKFREMLATMMEMVSESMAEDGMAMDEDAKAEAYGATEDEARRMMEEEENKMDGDMDEETMKTVFLKHQSTFVKTYVQGYMSAYNKRKAELASAAKDAMKAAREADGTPKRDIVGGRVDAARHDANRRFYANEGVGDARKFAGADGVDMGIALELLQKQGEPISDEFKRATVHKLAAQVNASKHGLAAKTSMPYKADELNASDIIGQGLEWVPETWSDVLWERARFETPVLNQLLARGAYQYQVDVGNQWRFPTEGSDPVIYSSGEANSLDVTNRPEAVYAPTPMGTGFVSGEFQAQRGATVYTDILEEDSIIPVAQNVNRQMMLAFTENMDRSVINADNRTTPNTNINAIDGTPTTGIEGDYYLFSPSGIRRSALDNAARNRSASGGLSLEDYRATIERMDTVLRSRRDRMFYIIDPDTETRSLAIPAIATDDVRRTFATITSGQLINIYGIDVYTSGFLPLTNTAGNVSITPANNVHGTILLVYAPYWGFAWKRRISMETARWPSAEATAVYASMRWAIAPRGTNASAATVHVGDFS